MQAHIDSTAIATLAITDELDHDFDFDTEIDMDDAEDDFDDEDASEADLGTISVAPIANRENREVRSARIAEDLPSEEDELIAAARLSLKAYDQAIRADNEPAALAAADRYEATVWKLNGGKFFGCEAFDHSPGYRIASGAAAIPGEVPMWGQRGEWLMDVAGMRVLVECAGGVGTMGHHYSFRVVDVAKPFLSDTGYRSFFGKPIYEATVEQAATIWINQAIADNRRGIPFVTPRSRASCSKHLASRAWLKASGAADSKPVYEEKSGQFALAF